MRHNIKKFFPVICLFVLSYFAIKPFLQSGFFSMHDDTQVARVFEMKKSLGDGMFPVRWVADLGYGYGYPIFNFYAPLAYYIGAAVAFLGFDTLMATKVMMALGIVLSGIFMYLFAKEFWGKWGGVIAGLLYLYAPYHAVDSYVRGDVAELWAYAFIPLVFFGLWKIHTERQWKYVVIGSLAYAGVILSHNLTAMMITPFVFVFAIFLFIQKINRKASLIFCCLLLGIVLSAFYWLPVFSEMQYTNVLSQVGGGADYKDHFVCLQQLWDSPWGFGGSTPTCTDGLSFKIGKVHLLLFFLSMVSLFFVRKENKLTFWVMVFGIVSAVVATYLMLAQSKFIWDAISPMSFFQYPWRFLLVVSFYVSFLGGSVWWTMNKLIRMPLITFGSLLFILFAILFINSKLFVPQRIVYKSVGDYTNETALRWTTSKISDEYMPKEFSKPTDPSEIVRQKLVPQEAISVLALSEKTQVLKVTVQANEKTNMIIQQAYFPGWHVFIDGRQSEFTSFQKGILIPVTSGQHTIELRFVQTFREQLGNLLSLLAAAFLLFAIIFYRKELDHAKKSG